MRSLPPIDAHAHIDAAIDHTEIRNLGALVMAVTRTLDEGDIATRRDDGMVIWGVGCHPGLKNAQNAFDAYRFQELLTRTAFAGELGLDGKSRVPMDEQVETLFEAFDVLRQNTPANKPAQLRRYWTAVGSAGGGLSSRNHPALVAG